MQEAGADAIELNLYGLVTDPALSSSQVEQDYCELVSRVKASVTIPVAVKLSQFFTAIPYVAQRLDEAGADALVLFNRFYQPEFDLESLEVVPSLTLSNSQELLLRLHWVALLYGRLKASLAVTGGVHTAERRPEGDHGRRKCRDDDFGAAAARDRACRTRARDSSRAGWRSTSTSRSAKCAAA